MADFPLILSTLDERRRPRVEAAIADLEAAPNGGIANPKFTEAKMLVNDMLDKAWDRLISEKYTWGGRWQELPEVVNDAIGYNSPSAHNMAGLVKKIEKAKAKAGDHAVWASTDAYFKEAVPLADLVNAAKDLIIKRQPKAAAETPKERYSKPQVSGSAVDQVKLLLQQIVDQGAAELRQTLTTGYKNYIDVYLQRQEAANAEGKEFSPRAAFRSGRFINMDAYEVVSRCTKEDHYPSPSSRREGRKVIWQKVADADAFIEERAEKTAKEIEEAFVYKNLAKIDSIVSAKGDYASGKMLSKRIGMGLEGRVRFEFKDGAAFTVQNSVVWSQSVHGTPFMRYPLTFHDVVMSDGSKMKGPSEKRMNTVWLGKDEE